MKLFLRVLEVITGVFEEWTQKQTRERGNQVWQKAAVY